MQFIVFEKFVALCGNVTKSGDQGVLGAPLYGYFIRRKAEKLLTLEAGRGGRFSNFKYWLKLMDGRRLELDSDSPDSKLFGIWEALMDLEAWRLPR